MGAFGILKMMWRKERTERKAMAIRNSARKQLEAEEKRQAELERMRNEIRAMQQKKSDDALRDKYRKMKYAGLYKAAAKVKAHVAKAKSNKSNVQERLFGRNKANDQIYGTGPSQSAHERLFGK
jgi:hypothetical protein